MNALNSDLFPSMPQYVRTGRSNRAYDGRFHAWMGGAVSLTHCRTQAAAKSYFGEGLINFDLRKLRPYRSRYDQLARDLLATNLRYLRLIARRT